MATNEINYSENSVVDLSGDTVNSEVLEEGYTAHDATGTSITGSSTAVHYGKVQTLTDEQKAQARDNIGALPADGTATDSSKLGGKPPEYYLQPVNLLDNSDFRNPVNQRGQTSYTAVGYTIDMWYSSNSNGVFSVGSGFVSAASASGSGAYFRQWIPSGCLELGKTYTLAVCDLDGLITTRSGELTEGATIPAFYPIQISTGAQIGFRMDYDSGKKLHNVMLSTSNTNPYQIKWIALYEGSYTAETLPPYVSKENEFASCQKRCVKIHCKNKPLGFGHAYTTDTFRFLIPTPVSMANDVVPSLGFELSDGTPSDAVSTILIASGGTLFTPTAVSVDGTARENGIILLCTVSGATKYQPASLYCSGNMLISIGP